MHNSPDSISRLCPPSAVCDRLPSAVGVCPPSAVSVRLPDIPLSSHPPPPARFHTLRNLIFVLRAPSGKHGGVLHPFRVRHGVQSFHQRCRVSPHASHHLQPHGPRPYNRQIRHTVILFPISSAARSRSAPPPRASRAGGPMRPRLPRAWGRGLWYAVRQRAAVLWRAPPAAHALVRSRADAEGGTVLGRCTSLPQCAANA